MYLNPATQLGHIRTADGCLFSNDREKAEAFNNYFHSVFTADDDNCPAFASRITANMNLPLFKPDEIRAALLASKSSSSCGPDGCPYKILKLFPELIKSSIN